MTPHDAGRFLEHRRDAWQSALRHEIEFWDDYIATGGAQWPDDFTWRTHSGRALDEDIVGLLRPRPMRGSQIRVLDVGAGPLSILGSCHPEHRIDLVPVDPLADEYDRMLERHGVRPPVRTSKCDGEALRGRFRPASFDVVHARNSIDHSYDPITVIRQMVVMMNDHGVGILVHHRNEGANASYEGLHQWNFDIRSGRMVIWGAAGEFDLAVELGTSVSITSWIEAGDIKIVLRHAEGWA